MTPEIFNYNKRAEKVCYPLRALELMAKNCDVPVSSTMIGEAAWPAGNDIYSVRSLVSRCRNYVRENMEGYSIYGIHSTSSYVLTRTRPVGSWITMPFEMRPELSIMSDSDKDLIHQLKVKKGDILFKRFSRNQYRLFMLLCDFSFQNDFGYISTRRIAKSLFGFDDYDEVNIVRGEIWGLKRRMECLDSIYVENGHGRGYRIMKK